MIPYTACLAFNPRQLHLWQLSAQRRGGISIGRTADLGLLVQIDSIPQCMDSGNLHPVDYALIEALDLSDQRTYNTGKFLTLNRRRRRVPLSLDGRVEGKELIDDVYHGQTKLALCLADQWLFNAFTLDSVSGGSRALPVLLFHLFTRYGLIEHYALDGVKVWKCFSLIEQGYHSNNPYHNAVHAADVTQAMHCFLQEEKIARHITPLEIMSALIASVAHDLDHPGVNQPFLIATSNHLAALYHNSSVLENHHWRSAVACILESNVFAHLDASLWDEIQLQVRSLILATDITRQQEFLTRFKRYMDENLLDLQLPETRHFILQISLKCADICNPCRPWDISKMWSDRVCEEFFRQGDFERQLRLPVTTFCDRIAMSKPKIQAGFFRFVVGPLFESWNRFHHSPLTSLMMKNLRKNQEHWDYLVQIEKEKEELEQEIRNEEDEETEEIEEISTRSSEHFEEEGDDSLSTRFGRRHSMPLSMPKLSLPRTIIRRQSFPKHREAQRALSAEALMPESRITSISKEAYRLSGLLSDPRGSKSLVKQMTYPPARTQQRIYSQSWEEACAALLPGVISPAVVAEIQEKRVSEGPKVKKCENGCGTPPEIVPALLDTRQSRRSSPKGHNKGMTEDKENKKPSEIRRLARRHSEEDAHKYSSRRSSSQGFNRGSGRRGSAPISFRSEEIAGGLRGGSERRRASVPVEALLDFQARRHSADSNFSYRRGSVPVCRRESLFSDTIHTIPSGSDSTLHDELKFVVATRRSSSPDRLTLAAQFALRRSSMPTEWQRKMPLSLSNFESSPDLLTRKGSGGIELMTALFRPRRMSADWPPQPMPPSLAARGTRWWRRESIAHQSESFDLGLLANDPENDQIEDQIDDVVLENVHIRLGGRRSSLPVDVTRSSVMDV
uniref:Phosphodiesterase n=1 Tax=Strigamia maritima TaxID=126957 RepID=T1J0B6_STRMM